MNTRPQIATLSLFLFFLTLGSALAEERKTWNITPREYPGVELGKVSVLEGWTDAQGVRTVLNGLSVDQPVQVSLIASEPGVPLKLEVMKGTWDNSLLEQTTDSEGKLTYRFRVSEQAAFQLTSEQETQYQMVVWVGPEMAVEPPPVAISMREFESPTTRSGDPLASPSRQVPSEDGRDPLIVGLLGGILATLVLISVLMLKGRKGTAVIAPGLMLLTLLSSPPAEATDKFTPKQHEAVEKHLKATDEVLQNLTKIAKDSGSKELRLFVAGLSYAFGYIDPRDAAIAPNYAPEGLPPLPIHALNDPSAKTPESFDQAVADLNKWRNLFETLYVIHKTTVLKTGRIIEMGEAAADLSPFAKLAWATGKHNQVNGWSKAEKNYHKTYDDAYNKLLKKLNESLLTIADYEREQYGEVDWYARYGMPYYLFMKDRYKRS